MADIQLNSHVIVQKLDGTHSRVVQVQPKKLVLVEKLKLYLDNAIGKSFGLTFDVKQQQLHLSEAKKEEPASSNGIGACDAVDVEMSDECTAQSSTDSVQAVTFEQLQEMRSSGVSGDQIVSKFVEGSRTYADKTVHAQDKYVRKKTRIHEDRVVLLKPTVRLLADIYYKKDCEKTGYLRPDILAQILTISNVRYAARILIMEQCQGLVTAGCLEKMGGSGMCLQVHRGVQAQAMPVVLSMDFDDQIMDTFYPVPISLLFDCEEEFRGALGNFLGISATPQVELCDIQDPEVLKRRKNQEKRKSKLESALDALKCRRMDSLVIALKSGECLEILKGLLRFVEFSSPIVLYAPTLEPLLECYRYLKNEQCAVNVQLKDYFFREYQVLSDRTHPEMTQYTAGGYLLTATTVVPE